MGVLANAESDSLAGYCGSGWALEYAGAVRNMLYASETVPAPISVFHCLLADRFHSDRATEALLACPGFLDHMISMVASASDWDVVLHACG